MSPHSIVPSAAPHPCIPFVPHWLSWPIPALCSSASHGIAFIQTWSFFVSNMLILNAGLVNAHQPIYSSQKQQQPHQTMPALPQQLAVGTERADAHTSVPACCCCCSGLGPACDAACEAASPAARRFSVRIMSISGFWRPSSIRCHSGCSSTRRYPACRYNWESTAGGTRREQTVKGRHKGQSQEPSRSVQ